MPEVDEVLPVTTETVTATVSVFPTPAPPAPPADPLPVAPPAPLLDEVLVSDLVKGINGLNTSLEGGETSGPAGPLLLDDVQFGVLGVALALIVALLAALFVVALRR